MLILQPLKATKVPCSHDDVSLFWHILASSEVDSDSSLLSNAHASSHPQFDAQHHVPAQSFGFMHNCAFILFQNGIRIRLLPLFSSSFAPMASNPPLDSSRGAGPNWDNNIKGCHPTIAMNTDSPYISSPSAPIRTFALESTMGQYAHRCIFGGRPSLALVPSCRFVPHRLCLGPRYESSTASPCNDARIKRTTSDFAPF